MVVDGEHYPPVIEAALDELRAAGHEILGAVLAGGGEKLPAGGRLRLAGVTVSAGSSAPRTLADLLARARPDAVLDLSDEPVLDPRRRHHMAAVALHAGVAYRGADFEFRPPPRPRLVTRPSMAVIGTGKRTGKTAVSALAARRLNAAGITPVVVAMGRGGPEEPEVLHGDEAELGPTELLKLADAGRHAASDYIEDALLARVATVGCRRCGGGLAGAVVTSNVARGVELANDLEGAICVLEGSGSAVPPVHADATVLVMPASLPHEYLRGYFGPFRLLLSDLVVVTLCEEPFGSPPQVSSLTSLIHDVLATLGGRRAAGDGIEVVRTVFRPSPTRPVQGAKAFVATTAPRTAGEAIRRHLETEYGCTVLGISHSLSNRPGLEADLDAKMKGADILLCEIKAAAVDVATRRALRAGLDVIYMDNSPVGVDGDDPAAALERLGRVGLGRFEDSQS